MATGRAFTEAKYHQIFFAVREANAESSQWITSRPLIKKGRWLLLKIQYSGYDDSAPQHKSPTYHRTDKSQKMILAECLFL